MFRFFFLPSLPLSLCLSLSSTILSISSLSASHTHTHTLSLLVVFLSSFSYPKSLASIVSNPQATAVGHQSHVENVLLLLLAKNLKQ